MANNPSAATLLTGAETALAGELVQNVPTSLMAPAVVRMAERGADPAFIAAMLQLPIHEVHKITITTRVKTAEDEEIGDMMRHLVALAYNRAVEVMELGPQNEQASLTRMILSHAMRLISGETSSQFDEMRTSFEGILTGMRYEGATNKEELDFENGSGTGPSFVSAFDSDEGFDD